MNNTISNPINDKWYADPEARFYEGEYWIYVTKSLPYKEQTNIDALHSKDLIHWETCENIIDMSGFPNATFAIWAPTIIEKNGKYYLIFACNDIHSDSEPGGLEIAVSDSPAGPFKAYTNTLVGTFINKAQPIDAHLFKDDDGTIYLLYGGWRRCNIGMLNENMDGFVPFSNGENFKEITPKNYVEAPCIMKYENKYYFMWSSGDWTKGSYNVRYAVSDNILQGYSKSQCILKEDPTIATGPGHNSYLYVPEKDMYLIVYHRHKPGEKDGNARYLCIDKMEIKEGEILPIKMTNSWEI